MRTINQNSSGLIVETIREKYIDGIGLEPLLNEFIYDISTLKPEEVEARKNKITGYYKAIYQRTGNLKLTYMITRNWCSKIFINPYIKRRLSNERLNGQTEETS